MEYNFRGKHDSTKSYVKKDVVSYQPNTSQPIKFYICLTDHSTPQIPNPTSDSQFWGVLNTSSNFPNSVDSFLYRANVQVTDQVDINRINELRTKPSLTVDEQNELNTLIAKHRNKLFLAEDINALQQSVSNMQLFFKDNIDAKLQDYNNQITQNKDDALTAIEKKKENIIEFMDSATAGQIRNDMGIMGELTTQAKDSLVNAINEVNAKEVDLTPIENSIGNKALLETDNKENLVNAINEVNGKPSIHIGTDAPTKGEFWLDGNEKLNYKNSTGVWKGVAPSQDEFKNHKDDVALHGSIGSKNVSLVNLQDGYTVKFDSSLDKFVPTPFLTDIPNINTSTSTITFYVDGTNGTDSPDKGGSQGTGAFKTIQYAVNKVKKLNVGGVTINIANGTYDEDIEIKSFSGGKITLEGQGSSTVIKSIVVSDITNLSAYSFNFTSKFTLLQAYYFSLIGIRKTMSTTKSSLDIRNSKGILSSCEFSNSTDTNNAGIYANNSEVFLSSVDGTGNNIGIHSIASTIKKGTYNTITGTTPQKVEQGGQILT